MTPTALKSCLSQQRECLLRKRIGLRQHGNTRLHEHLILRELRRLKRNVRITYPRFSRRKALTGDLEIRDGGLEAVLNRAVFRSSRCHRTDRTVDVAQRALGIGRRRDIYGSQADARDVQIVQIGCERVARTALEADKEFEGI